MNRRKREKRTMRTKMMTMLKRKLRSIVQMQIKKR